jgi:hypothetical protein
MEKWYKAYKQQQQQQQRRRRRHNIFPHVEASLPPVPPPSQGYSIACARGENLVGRLSR